MTFRSKPNPIISALLITLLAASAPAFAGGLSSVSQGLTTFQVWFYSFAGILATCYLTYKAIMAMSDREHWSDFAAAIGKVVVAGSVVGLVGWAWALATG
jgi:hypothetical protein